MTQTLDFLIGGMPRGGTTAVGTLFNLPDESYCYAAETHWLPFLLEVAGDAPVPTASIEFVERLLSAQNRTALYEMFNYSRALGRHKVDVIFQEEDLPRVTESLMTLLRDGLYGAPLMVAASQILRQHLAWRTDRTVLGEKTPSNVKVFNRFGAVGSPAAIMVMREPYAVLRSMAARAAEKADIYANDFRGDIYRRIGIWLDYARAIKNAADRPNTWLLRYEELIKNPSAVIHDLYAKVGIDITDGLMARAVSSISVSAQVAEAAGMPARDFWITRALTHKLSIALGYGDSFDALRDAPNQSPEDIDLSQEGIYAVSGVHPESAGHTPVWLMREGNLVVQSRRGASECKLQFWSRFPEIILPENQTAHLLIHDDKWQRIAELEVSRIKPNASIVLNLKKTEPILVNHTGEVRLYSFCASHFFRPCLIQIIDQKNANILSADRREMSLAMVDAYIS